MDTPRNDLVVFKAQLGEHAIGSLISSLSLSLSAQNRPTLKRAKPALKHPNWQFKMDKAPKLGLKWPNQHSTECLGELCLNNAKQMS